MIRISHNSDPSRQPLVADVWPDSVKSVPIRPGMTVLVKPNLVLDRHPKGGDIRCLVATGEVILQILRLVGEALQGEGRIIVGDSPLQTTDFEAALQASGIGEAIRTFEEESGWRVEVIDFRQVHAQRDEGGHIVAWKEVPGDPAGYVTIDLDGVSLLCPHEAQSDQFRVSNYQAEDTLQYHGVHKHRYVIARTVLDADVIISVPKMKTHCKVGVTLAMKNFVGTVGRKQCLAHHREGGAGQGGDEYPDDSRLKGWSVWLENAIDGLPASGKRWVLKQLFRVNERLIRMLKINPIRDGGWYGNDTCWRMTLDLVRIAGYGRVDGTMAEQPQRQILTVVDGIVAGEGEGPLEATPVPANTLVYGDNPVETDILTAAWMGFDYRQIPLLRDAPLVQQYPLVGGGAFDRETLAAEVNGELVSWPELLETRLDARFAAPAGWVAVMQP